jgi:hypothetical protein
MPTADHYRKLAAEFRAKARLEERPGLRLDFNRLAKSYLLLAEQAEKNEKMGVSYETPSSHRGDDFSSSPR